MAPQEPGFCHNPLSESNEATPLNVLLAVVLVLLTPNAIT
jgi:hypothetical protein